jgi:hypothetical protein
MCQKETPELVTSGPYALIRHPIYTGLMLAMLDSAMGVNVLWGLLLIPVGAYFIYSARREETVLLQHFPEQYAAYRAHTGMLAPAHCVGVEAVVHVAADVTESTVVIGFPRAARKPAALLTRRFVKCSRLRRLGTE